MNWQTKELNNIIDLSDLKGRKAKDKFNDTVDILDAFRIENKLSTATIKKTNKDGTIKIVDVPLCCLRVMKE